MRAVFFRITNASTLTRSTSTLMTSASDSGVGVGVGGSWIAFRLGRPLFVLKFLLGVCEVTELEEEKSSAATTISENVERVNRRVGDRCFIRTLSERRV